MLSVAIPARRKGEKDRPLEGVVFSEGELYEVEPFVCGVCSRGSIGAS